MNWKKYNCGFTCWTIMRFQFATLYSQRVLFQVCNVVILVWVKLRHPNHWMVNSKNWQICGPPRSLILTYAHLWCLPSKGKLQAVHAAVHPRLVQDHRPDAHRPVTGERTGFPAGRSEGGRGADSWLRKRDLTLGKPLKFIILQGLNQEKLYLVYKR